VSSLQEAEDAAVPGLQLLGATLDSLEAHIALLDADGRTLITNRAWADFAAANVTSANGPHGNHTTLHEDSRGDSDAGGAAAGLRSVLAGALSEFAMEYRCDTDTEERWFLLRAARMARGGRARMLVSHEDITDRVRAERASSATRGYVRALAASTGEGLFTLDEDGRVVYANQAAELLLGWPRGGLRGRVMHEEINRSRADGSELAIEDCPMMQTLLDRVPRRIDDDVFYGCDGRRLPVAYSAAPFETIEGRPGCVVVLHDVSRRKIHRRHLLRAPGVLSSIGRIQDALAQDRLLLYAQPIADVNTSEVVQQELLLRMREPDGSIAAPGTFLQIAEEYGLIGNIDRWVIRRAAEIAATAGRSEINISARSIGDPGILEHLERAVAEAGTDPAQLVFEVTETAIIEDEAAAQSFAKRLQQLGCKLALDDFGTGYGSFTYLKKLPLDFLKIDIEFVRDLLISEASRSVVRAIVAIAHDFDLKTVAEGVEDRRTVELARELGVDFAQGYYVGRPRALPEPSTVAPPLNGLLRAPLAPAAGPGRPPARTERPAHSRQLLDSGGGIGG
jgi:PAS domain S-box-containing protein